MKGRTTLIVTHRIRTVHHIARIVVLDCGRIVEEGRGPELLKAEATIRDSIILATITALQPLST